MEITNSRISNILNDTLLETYRSASVHFKNNDLVLFYYEGKDNDKIDAHVRKRLISEPDIPAFLKNKLTKPAKDAISDINYHEVAFWLVVFFADGEVDCAAVNATLLAPGGNA